MKFTYEKPTAEVVNLAAMAEIASGKKSPFALRTDDDGLLDDFSVKVEIDQN